MTRPASPPTCRRSTLRLRCKRASRRSMSPTSTGIFGTEYMSQAMPKILDALKAETAKYEASDIIGNRDKIRSEALKAAQGRLQDFVEVQDLSIVNVSFSEDYEKAIEAKQVAQQRAEQAKYELQQAQGGSRSRRSPRPTGEAQGHPDPRRRAVEESASHPARDRSTSGTAERPKPWSPAAPAAVRPR